MMVMTAKVNFRKILLGLAAVAALVLALILLLGGGKAEETSAPALRSNDGRVKFLEDLGGWYKVQIDGVTGYMGSQFF